MLRAALARAVVRRHEALRTVFAAVAGVPRQEILPPSPVPLPVVELSALDAGRRQRACRGARVGGRGGARFDLGRGPLLRAAVLRLEAADQLLLLTLHHIVTDGWSMVASLAAELAALYGALAGGAAGAACHGSRCSMPTTPCGSAAGCAARCWTSELAYWRHRLRGLPPLLALPHRPAAAAGAGHPRGGTLEAALAPALAGEARCCRPAAGRRRYFMTLLAAFAALLGRHSGQPRLAIGTPVLAAGAWSWSRWLASSPTPSCCAATSPASLARASWCGACARSCSPRTPIRICPSSAWSRS